MLLKRVLLILLLAFGFTSCDSNKTIDSKKARQTAPKELSLLPKLNPLQPAFVDQFYDSISQYYMKYIEPGFNGMFLIAKNGKVVFERYQGIANKKFDRKIDKHTPLHVASMSKVITALIVCKLADEKKLKLDQDIRRYLPEIMYPGITVRMLLNHRSGLPYYGYFPYSVWPANKQLTNEKIIELMNNYQLGLYFKADSHFSYCNTNYALLALIAERVTQTKFPQLAKKMIFEPLKMTDSFVNDGSQNTDSISRSYDSRGRIEVFTNLDGIYGDKNVYTTARDLLKLDVATYSDRFLSQSIKAEIFKGYSFERRSKSNYGLGYRIREENGKSTLFFHTGWWHGNTGCYASLRNDTICMVVISNHYTKKVFSINRLSSIFGNYPYEPLVDMEENYVSPAKAKAHINLAIQRKQESDTVVRNENKKSLP